MNSGGTLYLDSRKKNSEAVFPVTVYFFFASKSVHG